MRERPMLFSGSMIRAILSGSKSQTRRVVKPQPMEEDGQIYDGKIFGPEMYEPAIYDKHGEMVPGPEIFGIYPEDGEWGIKCPYGQPGDQLWVRETWAKNRGTAGGYIYRADHGECSSYLRANLRSGQWEYDVDTWKPSIHMPRAASRIQLEITDVRVERLQDCSEADAIAEGAPGYEEGIDCPPPDGDYEWSYKDSYQRLWESINGPGSWDANPWVWVVEFRRIKP